MSPVTCMKFTESTVLSFNQSLGESRVLLGAMKLNTLML